MKQGIEEIGRSDLHLVLWWVNLQEERDITKIRSYAMWLSIAKALICLFILAFVSYVVDADVIPSMKVMIGMLYLQ